MYLNNLTKESIKSQEDDIRYKLSGFIREYPGTYVSLSAANIYLRITDPTNFGAVFRFYQQDFPALTDLVQSNMELGKLGLNFPVDDIQRVLLYETLGKATDQPYELVKVLFQQLEHVLQIG